ncbi:MAG: hypothetical protein CVV41_17910 [Candidatus Riflebacteria bacterium HGW-Riflebacteria-1]|jgi:hypothetical protein|nr:MAG: hypothetical protein CVV41_17910 [Candidatus Riflebacteria bacterium HGW-Riflebacteria-1]
MNRSTKHDLLQSRFPLFAGLALFICFGLFPLFLIDAAVNRILQIQHGKNLNKTRQKLESALDLLDSCSNNRHFAHLLLNHAFSAALASDNPSAKLQFQLNALKKRHPGVFLFAVWDDKGRIIQQITDETSFTYMLREVYKLLQDLAENCRRYYPGAPEKITGFERRLKIVRHYIGRVVSLNWIQRPLQSGRRASAIVAEPEGSKSHLWYSVDSQITMLAFIHSDFFVGQSGLEFAIKRLQEVNPELKAGYCRYPIEPATIFQHDCQANPVDIALAISRFENLHPGSLLHYANRVFSYRYISPAIRAFCHVAENTTSSIQHRKREIAGAAVKWLIILAFLCWVAAKKYQLDHISARLKLSALFLYAGGIPVLIIFIIGADYLQQKRNELIYAEQSHGLEKLRQIDEGFAYFLNRLSAEILVKLHRHINSNLPLTQQKTQIASMRKLFAKDYQPGSIMLFDTEGRNQISSEGNMPFPDASAISQVSKEVLEFLNASETYSFSLSQIAKPIAIDIGYRAQVINSFSLGDHETYAFFGRVGKTQDYAASGMFYLFWRQEHLQRKYLELVMHDNPGFTAYFPETDRFLSGNAKPAGQLSQLLYKAASMLVVRETEIINHSNVIFAAAMRGNNMHKSCLAVSVPITVIDDRMRVMYYGFAIVSGLFLFFCSGGIIMMRHRLLLPLQQFKEAIEAIGQRNFRYRPTIVGDNEFGKLSKALNHTLENLSELEVARIVQENLLPGREYQQNRLCLLASLSQMSHIGGDYYDFFAVNKDVSGVFIGDVSGHGISSALFMAMARSAMIFENFNEPEQGHLMQTLNNVIYQMRKSGAKEYMSGLSLFINSNTGQFSLFNAGHCPPAIIRHTSGKVELQMCKGLYFGFKEKYEAKALTGKLETGDFLVLYTDSWVESVSKSGLTFGFARFEQSLLNCCDSNLEIFANQMFATISRWESERNDDMTLLLIRFGEKNGN